jgi:sulfite reductase (NADPH) flavoprotein alpha-component
MIFLVVLSVTGFFIGSEESLYRVVRSEPQPAAAKPHSVTHGNAAPAANIGLNRALQTADLSLPGLRTARIRLPLEARDTYVVEKRVPDWSVGGANSAVYIDQYNGQPLRVDDVRAYTRGFRAYRLNSALHTGSIFGLAGRIILAVSSLALALLVVTGILIWVKKQGWMNSARKTSGIELTAGSTENLEMSGG